MLYLFTSIEFSIDLISTVVYMKCMEKPNSIFIFSYSGYWIGGFYLYFVKAKLSFWWLNDLGSFKLLCKWFDFLDMHHQRLQVFHFSWCEFIIGPLILHLQSKKWAPNLTKVNVKRTRLAFHLNTQSEMSILGK